MADNIIHQFSEKRQDSKVYRLMFVGRAYSEERKLYAEIHFVQNSYPSIGKPHITAEGVLGVHEDDLPKEIAAYENAVLRAEPYDQKDLRLHLLQLRTLDGVFSKINTGEVSLETVKDEIQAGNQAFFDACAEASLSMSESTPLPILAERIADYDID